MVWVSIIVAAISIWAASLWRILSSSPCIPSSPAFLFASSGSRRNVLLVTAHPDDESMFFAPTILYLISQGHKVHILCMSIGNADGLGGTRQEELYRACAIFKLPPEQIKIFDHPNLQDGFGEKWDHHLLTELVEEQIREWGVDSIITFDKFGVSGHPNHRDVHHGICKLVSKNLQRDVEAWELISTDIFLKYSGPVSFWLSLCSFSSSKQQIYCLPNSNPFQSYKAMAQHESQWVWFRKLFVLFSSYTYMNTLQKISI